MTATKPLGAMTAVFGDGTEPIEHVAARARQLLGPDAIVWEGDASTFEFTYVNDAAERVLGHPARAWIDGATFWADTVVYKDDRDDAIAYCALATAKCSDHRFEYRARALDGTIVWLRDYVQVIVGGAKRLPERLRGIMIDVSADKRVAASFDARGSLPEQFPPREELLAQQV